MNDGCCAPLLCSSSAMSLGSAAADDDDGHFVSQLYERFDDPCLYWGWILYELSAAAAAAASSVTYYILISSTTTPSAAMATAELRYRRGSKTQYGRICCVLYQTQFSRQCIFVPFLYVSALKLWFQKHLCDTKYRRKQKNRGSIDKISSFSGWRKKKRKQEGPNTTAEIPNNCHEWDKWMNVILFCELTQPPIHPLYISTVKVPSRQATSYRGRRNDRRKQNERPESFHGIKVIPTSSGHRLLFFFSLAEEAKRKRTRILLFSSGCGWVWMDVPAIVVVATGGNC